jgi:hypothetical protein
MENVCVYVCIYVKNDFIFCSIKNHKKKIQIKLCVKNFSKKKKNFRKLKHYYNFFVFSKK